MSYNYRSISNEPVIRQSIIHPYCYWHDTFNNDEIENICSLMDEYKLDEAHIASDNPDKSKIEVGNPIPVIDHQIRRSKVSFHSVNEKNKWIFERLNALIEMMNNRWFNFDLNGYDQFQYAEYHDYQQGYYDWHVDIFLGNHPKQAYSETRKLSLTFLLNEPEKDFQGGHLQFGNSNDKDAESVFLKKGTIILFPSWMRHRVTPVTKGVRKSIVVWVLGPKFK